MVKVGIIGAESPLAGEIIRILINHPETEIVAPVSPALAGRSFSSRHHGFIGETQYNFTDKIDPEEIDLLIIADDAALETSLLEKASQINDLKTIALSEKFIKNSALEYTLGVSEINRKALVRGARHAYIPSPAILSSIVALGPLAGFLLLNADIDIEVQLPSDIIESLDLKAERDKLTDILKGIQNSFDGNVNLSVKTNDNPRAAITEIRMQNGLALDEIEKIYDGVYDDHNFTFLTHKELDPKEVTGTQKILINISKPSPDTLLIKSVADARMRGGAGDAVHVLNLFFGLHEKTGLTLRNSEF